MSEFNINSIVDCIPTIAMLLDENLIIKNVNEKFLSFMRLESKDVIGKSINDFPFVNLQQYFVHISLLRNRDLTIIDALDIGEFKKSVSFFIHEGLAGNSYLVIGVDLSKDLFRQEADEQMKHQYEENAKFMLIGQMAAGVAHEINNPLAIISGSLLKMKRVIDDAGEFDKKNFLDKISKSEKSIERISSIVRGLNFLAKNNLNAPFEVVQIQEILDNVIDLCSDKLKTSGISLVIDPAPADMKVECRPVQITQVMLNLIVNAHDAVDAIVGARWIKISFDYDNGKNIIAITDSGAGIPQEIRTKIMQPFFTTKSESKGVGLGLSTSKMIMQDNSGDLVYDETSSNTKFKLILKPGIVT